MGSRQSNNCSTMKNHQSAPHQAFTFIELLIVIAALALLAVMILPARADIKNKGGRMQCAANLRQIGMGSMMYANDFNTQLPTGKIGANPQNVIHGFYYTRYVWEGTVPNYKLPSSFQSPFGNFENAGYLYPGGYTDIGNALYCPATWGTVLGASLYSPLLTSDSAGTVRSSYAYNPRVANAAGGTTQDHTRRYLKTSQLQPRKLFAVDYLDRDPTLFAHQREMGWNVLFSDCSVKFSQNNTAHNLVKIMGPQYFDSNTDQLLDSLELDH